jgi:hypothetical protein
MRWIRLSLLALLLVLPAAAQEYTRFSEPEFFSYEELVTLSQDAPFKPDLAKKLETITTTPFISNEAHYRGAKPRKLEVQGLGHSLRVVFWNIERGVMLDDIILLFTDKDAFLEKVAQSRAQQADAQDSEETASPSGQESAESRKGLKLGPRAGGVDPYENIDMDKLADDVEILQAADVIVLNEVDWGMPRSDYREVIVDLGRALNMNWAFAAEFIEIDPVVLGLENFHDVEDEEERKKLLELTRADKERLRAVHGTAILSRYPIRDAAVRPFRMRAYDWYRKEKGIRPVEKGFRVGSTLIGSPMAREMRRGGRTTLTVELDVPELPEKRLTVVSPHLENRTKPKNRQRQMREVLDQVKGIRNPLIVAGDLNTTGGDSEAFRLERHLYKKYTEVDTWVNQGVKWGTGVGLGYDVLKFGFKFTKNVSDPTAKSVPFLAPNKEHNLFAMVEKFRFDDGTVFDFRGVAERTSNGNAGTLASSNQRAPKGFSHTYEFVITLGVLGKYKLDWIFVKSYLEQTRNKQGPYAFAPHFARTMPRVNFALREQPLSDHNPMAVDLPLSEPAIVGRASGQTN